MRDGNPFPFIGVRILLVYLACESIVLFKCSGKYIDTVIILVLK